MALYAPSLGHPFLFDDAVQLSENPAVTAGAPLRAYLFDPATTSSRPDYNTRIYRPLRNLAFRAVAVVAGVRPIAYHVTNLALYVLSALLVWWLAWRTSGDRLAAGWAAALWAAAPVHVEPVLYASALGDQLSLALELGAILSGIALIREGAGRRGVALGLLSVTLAFLAMLAKEMAVTTVGLLALGALLAGSQVWRLRRAWLLVCAHLAAALGYLALRTSVVGRLGQEDVTAASLGSGLREAPVLLVEYARLAAAPLGHRAAYVVPPPSSLRLMLTLVGLAAALAVAWVIDRKKGAAPGLRLGLGWFVIALLPVLHVVPLWADLADRFALVPSVGLALAVASAIALLPPARRARMSALFGTLLLLLYAGGTVVEARAWKSDVALWSHAADREPGSPLAQANLGAVLLSAGRFEEALAALDRAQALGRDGADLSHRRAMALAALERLPEAETAVLRAVALSPALGPAHALAGDVARRRGKLDAAAAALALAQKHAPEHPSTLMLAAAMDESRGRPAEAARAYAAVAARFPSIARYRYVAGRAALAAGDRAGATEAARVCLSLEPGQPQCTELLAQAAKR